MRFSSHESIQNKDKHDGGGGHNLAVDTLLGKCGKLHVNKSAYQNF